jgi:hypothetical protein
LEVFPNATPVAPIPWHATSIQMRKLKLEIVFTLTVALIRALATSILPQIATMGHAPTPVAITQKHAITMH